MLCFPRMQPLIGAGELIVTAWHIFRKNFILYAEFALWFIVIVLCEWFLKNVAGSMVSEPSTRATIVTLVGIPFSLLYVALIAAMTDATAHAIQNKPTTVRGSLGFGVHRLIPFLWASFLFGSAVLGGTVLFIIPGIFLLVALQFAFSYVVVDEVGGTASLLASYRLVSGRWWTVATRLAVPCIFFVLVDIFLTSVLQLVAGAFFGDPGLFFGSIPVGVALPTTYAVFALLIPRLVSGFTLPLWRAAELTLWYDLKRTRPEQE